MRNRDGFTLIEILLALLIGSIVLASVYGVFSGVSQARNRLEAEGDVYHQARIFFDRLGSELASIRLAPVGSQSVFKAGNDDSGNFYFEFNSELVSPLLKRQGGLSRIRYEVQQEKDSATLLRSEKVLLTDLSASKPLPFISHLKSFKLRCFRHGHWTESWADKSPPQLIEVALELEVADQILPFRSSFILSEGE